jgi:hypothetical protein
MLELKMKLFLILSLLGFSSLALANQDLGSYEIDKALDQASPAEFQEIYSQVVTHLKEAEAKEEFDSRLNLALFHSPKFSFIKSLIQSTFVVSGYDDLCFFGGWMSKKGGNNKCRMPWKMRTHSKFKREHSAHVYSRQYNCGGVNFRCNPLIFGTNTSGKGKCVTYDPVRNLSARCAAASAGNIDNHIRNLKEDPILRKKFAHYMKFLLEECKNPGSSTCKALKGHMTKLYAKAKESNDVNLCQAIVEPIVTAGNFIDVGARIDALPVPSRQPSDDSDDSQTGLTSIEDEMFRNYKKLGGNPKAFAHVMCFFKKHQDSQFQGAHRRKLKITEKCKIIINDYTKGSNEKRLFVMNRCTGKVKAMQSSHGKGGGSGAPVNSHQNAKHFSNRFNTRLSPSGFFIMGGWHHTSKVWHPGIKMHGLQKGVNDNSYGRGIVLHRSMTSSGGYCYGGIATSDQSNPRLRGQSCGRTWGCIGLDPSKWSESSKDLLGTRNGGPLLYTYSPREAAKSASYCGDKLWQ